jgi:hypothetical protein
MVVDSGFASPFGWFSGVAMDTSEKVDTSENKRRVLELAWRNYEGQVAATVRTKDRVAVVIGSSVAGIGLVLQGASTNAVTSTPGRLLVGIAAVALMTAFVFACRSWMPSGVGIPSSTDRDLLWHYLVNVEDDVSAATLIGDVCFATDQEERETILAAGMLQACMVCCGIAIVASVVVRVI